MSDSFLARCGTAKAGGNEYCRSGGALRSQHFTCRQSVGIPGRRRGHSPERQAIGGRATNLLITHSDIWMLWRNALPSCSEITLEALMIRPTREINACEVLRNLKIASRKGAIMIGRSVHIIESKKKNKKNVPLTWIFEVIFSISSVVSFSFIVCFILSKEVLQIASLHPSAVGKSSRKSHGIHKQPRMFKVI